MASTTGKNTSKTLKLIVEDSYYLATRLYNESQKFEEIKSEKPKIPIKSEFLVPRIEISALGESSMSH